MAKFVFTFEDRDGGIDFLAERDETPIPEDDNELTLAQRLAAQIIMLTQRLYHQEPVEATEETKE